MAGPTVGVIANPLAGKDIRRLVAEATHVSDGAKIAMVRRALIGAVEGGATRLLLSDDRRSLAARAVDRLRIDAEVVVLDEPIIDSGRNSQAAAVRMRQEGVGAVIVLGGDGTHRDVAKGWADAPMVTLSTGTNNVFPRQVESTLAGHAAGLVASGAVALRDSGFQAKTIRVDIEDSETDLALVDVALVEGSFIGSRAVWDGARIRELVAAIAEPESVGLSAIAAALAPTDRRDPGGVHARLCRAGDPVTSTVRAPIGPGLYEDIAVENFCRLKIGDTVRLAGPGVLSFDGERDVVLDSDQTAAATLTQDGPHVIDISLTLSQRQQS